jgi:hypothetical protein
MRIYDLRRLWRKDIRDYGPLPVLARQEWGRNPPESDSRREMNLDGMAWTVGYHSMDDTTFKVG